MSGGRLGTDDRERNGNGCPCRVYRVRVCSDELRRCATYMLPQYCLQISGMWRVTVIIAFVAEDADAADDP